MIDEIDWAKPPRQTTPRLTSCGVCGLRAEVLICKECANDTAASIRWLETLPQGNRVDKALALLRGMG